jgi:hypothetical protein
MGRAVVVGAWIAISAAGFMWAGAHADGLEQLSLTPLHVGGRAGGASSTAGSALYPDATPRHHNGPGAVCEDCHVLHVSKSKPPSSGMPRRAEALSYGSTTNPFLLKASDPLDLCLSCHDGRMGVPDVMGADANGLVERSAGHFDRTGTFNPRGHDLGLGLRQGSSLCARCHSGGGGGRQVTCIDCHNPHGNGVARNLQWASDPESTPDLGLFVSAGASGMQRYEARNVSYGTLDSDALREVSNMCLDCHHIFSGSTAIDPNGDGIHSRHPSYDSERGSPNVIAMGAVDGGSDPAHWEAGIGSGFSVPRVRFVVSGAADFSAAGAVDARRNGVFCLSCHKAHGSGEAFAMTWPLSDGYRAPGCDQCHAMAGSSPSASLSSLTIE